MSIFEDAWNAINTSLNAAGSGTGWLAGKTVAPVYNATLGSWGTASEQDYSSPVALALARVQQAQQAAQAHVVQDYSGLSQPWQQLAEYMQQRPAYEANPAYQQLSPEYQELFASMQQRQGAPTVAQQAAIDAQVQTTEQDFSTLFSEQRDTGAIKDWQGLSRTLVQLHETAKDSGDDDQIGFVQGVLNDFQEDIQPHIEVLFPGWWDQNFQFDEGNSLFERGAGAAFGLAGPALEQLNRPWQHIAKSIAVSGVDPETGEERAQDDLGGVLPGLQQLFSFLPGIDEVELGEGVSFDADQSGDIGFREAIGMDPQAGGTLGGILDLGAQITLDPVTWATFGTGAVIKGALTSTAKVAGREGAEAALRHQTVWTKVLRDGYKSLDEGEQAFMERLIREVAHDRAAVAYAGLTGRAREATAKAMMSNRSKIQRLSAKEQKLYEKTLNRVQQGGRSGFKMAGKTLIPFNNRFSRGLGLMDEARFEDRTASVVDGYDIQYRPEEYTRWDDVTREQTRQVFEDIPRYETRWRAVADEIPVDESVDPRIDLLRRKAEGTNFEAEAVSFNAKADELYERLRTQAGNPSDRTNLRWESTQVQTGTDRVMREVVEEITERVARNDVRWIEEIVPRMRTETFQVIVDNSPGLLRRIVQSDNGFAAGIRQRLIPRANINARAGAAAGEAFVSAQRKAQGTAMRMTDDISKRLKGPIRKKAEREWIAANGGDTESFFRFLNEAMADPEKMAKAMVESGPRTSGLLGALQDARQQVWNTLSDADKARFGNELNYIPRVMSDRGAEYLSKLSRDEIRRLKAVSPELGRIAEELKDGKATIGEIRNRLDDRFLNKRGIDRDLQNLFEVNDEVRAILKQAGIEDAADLYTTDVMAAWSLRAKSAFQSRIEADIFDGLRNLVDENGEALIVNARERADGRISKFNRDEITVGGETYWAHKDIAAAFKEVRETILDPQRMDELAGVWDSVNGMWARYATLSPGFHSRNAMGNVFMAFLGGLSNPARYVDAISLQRLNRKAHKIMGDTGLSFEEAFAQIKKIPVEELAQNADFVVIREMMDNRIMSGLVGDIFLGKDDADFGTDTLFNIRNRSKANVTHVSRALGTAIEHNARVALYLDATLKGMGPEAAAAHVRQYLLDYEDLTRFETKVRRNLSRFYTWMRKNTALQVMTLAKTPGKILNAERIVDEMMSMIFGETDSPEDAAMLPRWAQVVGMDSRGGDGIGFDSPFYSGMNTIENLMAVPTMVYDITADATGLPPLSGGLANAIAYNKVQLRAQQAMSLFSGLPKSAADFLYGERLGYDVFTGGSLEYSKLPQWARMASLVNPVVSRGFRVAESVEDAKEGKTSLSMEAANWLGGFRHYTGEKAEAAARFTLLAEVEKLVEESGGLLDIDAMRDEGRLDVVNRFMYIQAYGGMTTEGYDPQKLREELGGLVPKEVLDLYPQFRGMDRRYPTQALPEDDLVAAQQKLADAERALAELLGRPLSQREKVNLLLNSDMLPYTDELESVQVEPFRDWTDPTVNVFTRDNIPDILNPRPDPIERLNALGSAIGLNAADVQQLAPFLSDIERYNQQALATGATPEEAARMVDEYIISNMSRTDLSSIFGEDVLTAYAWLGYDDTDAAYDMNRAWQDAATLRFIYQMRGIRLTEEELMEKVIHMNMGQTDQRHLQASGLLSNVSPYPPSRENIQTPQEQAQDAVRQAQALAQGVAGTRWSGPFPEEDPRNEWEW